jgi:hypothetical protein
VTKYHVEFDFETFGSEELRVGDFFPIPADAVITELAPAVVSVAGWYRRNEKGVLDVLHWTAEEIEEYPAEQFYQNFTRMKDPEPWVEKKYKDGYYRMGDGYLYRRQAGRWEMFLPTSGGWDESSYTDDNIEEDCTVQYLGVDAP